MVIGTIDETSILGNDEISNEVGKLLTSNEVGKLLTSNETGKLLTVIEDGISIFKKEAIQKIGGWNEDFLGLGYSNKFQDMKITKMLNFKQMDFYGYHLHHSTENVDMGLVQRNQQILDYYANPQADLNSHINLTVPKIGFLNKYQF